MSFVALILIFISHAYIDNKTNPKVGFVQYFKIQAVEYSNNLKF